ncbi:aspartate/glutamate racemase family protein [Streptomyces sp. NPDC054861]
MLVNPNTSAATTAMMTAIARRTLGPAVRGVTARHGPPMLTDPAALRAAVPEVVAAGRRALAAGDCAALIVAAFGDPGLDALRAVAGEVPVVGIGEASLREASAGGTRFGIATTTPRLAVSLADGVAALGLTGLFTGLRLTDGDPATLSADPDALLEGLARAVRECVARDGAEAVVIGGGPLAAATETLAPHSPVPLIAPVPAACRRVRRLLTG